MIESKRRTICLTMKLPLKLPLLVGAMYLPTGRAQCNETEALLKVSYSIDEDEWSKLPFWSEDFSSAYLEVRPQGIVREKASVPVERVEYRKQEEAPKNFEMCLPRMDACAQVAVINIPPKYYEISWDGVPVADSGASIPNRYYDVITVTDAGDCIPSCDHATEALFEYQTLETFIGGFIPRFRVEDAAGSPELECDGNKRSCGAGEGGFFSLFKARRCLKRDACHRLIMGKSFRFGFSKPEQQMKFSLHWDGDLVAESDSWLFESIKFGKGCDPDCTDGESLVEFFMYSTASSTCNREMPDWENDVPETRVRYQHPDFPWELTMHPEDGSALEISNGNIHACDRELFREYWCVPRDSCVSFRISSANETRNRPVYTLSMDGETYHMKEWRLDNTTRYGSYDFDGLVQETLMGECAVSNACGDDHEALFEVEVKNPERYWNDYENKFQSNIPGRGFVWVLSEPNATLKDTRLKGWSSTSHFGDFDSDPGAVFRTLLCVPDYDCELGFGISLGQENKNNTFEYKLERNGVELNDTLHEGNTDVIVFGEDCSDGGDSEGDNGGNEDGGSNSAGGCTFKAYGSIIALALGHIAATAL